MRVTSRRSGDTYDIDALRHRDPAVMDAVVRNESARVYSCIRRLIRDADEAQSLVQETFLQAIRKIDSFRGDAKLSTWLCSIGINLARASLRKSTRYDLLEESDLDRLQPSFTSGGRHASSVAHWNPEEAIERDEMKSIIHNAIDRLPDGYRTVIVLRDIQEMEAEEVAQIMGISDGAMRVRLHRARQALRKLLDDQISH